MFAEVFCKSSLLIRHGERQRTDPDSVPIFLAPAADVSFESSSRAEMHSSTTTTAVGSRATSMLWAARLTVVTATLTQGCNVAFSVVSGDCVAEHGDVRITMTTSRSSIGRLEMYTFPNGWSSVCGDGFGTTEASYACKNLGYYTGSVIKPPGSALVPGTPTGLSISGLDCSCPYCGNINDCARATAVLVSSDECTNYAAISCHSDVYGVTVPIEEATIRFAEGDSAAANGRVEYFWPIMDYSYGVPTYPSWLAGKTSSICLDDAAPEYADVICRKLGFGKGVLENATCAESISQGKDDSYTQAMVANPVVKLVCDGSNASLTNCRLELVRQYGCDASQTTVVSCGTYSSFVNN